jgi:hypothetical protein
MASCDMVMTLRADTYGTGGSTSRHLESAADLQCSNKATEVLKTQLRMVERNGH